MAVNVPVYLQNTDYDAIDWRLALGSLYGPPTTGLSRPGGVVPGYGGSLAVAQTGPSMNVAVASGAATVGAASAGGGGYILVNDASVTLPIGAAHPSLARVDLVIARIKDAEYGDATSGGLLDVIAGTPGGGAPAVPSGFAVTVLAAVTVRAAAASVLTGDIADRRTWAVAVGGMEPVLSTARPTAPYPGMPIYETDNDVAQVYSVLTAGWKRLSPIQMTAQLTRTTGGAPQSIPSDPTLTQSKLSWTHADRAVGFTVSTPVTTFTIPATGTGDYLVTASIPFETGTGGNQRTARLYLNDDAVLEARVPPITAPGGTIPTTVGFSTVMYLAGGDQLFVVAYHDDPAALHIGYDSVRPRWTITRVAG